MSSKKKNFLKIVILGDSGVGKTTLLQQFLNGKVTGSAKPTIGADFSKKEITIDNTTVTLQIWDTAGQEKFQSLGYAFYRGADCCCLVYDITNAKSFENLDKWKTGFIENAGPDDVKSFPFVLLGNKIDKEQDRKTDTNTAQDWCRRNNDMLYFETSAKEGVSVEQAFYDIAKKAMQRETSASIMMPDSIGGASGAIKLTNNDKGKREGAKTKSKCC